MLQTHKTNKETLERKTAGQTYPFRTMANLEYPLERLFEQFWNRPFSTLWGRDPVWSGRTLADHMPSLDVIDEKDRLLVKAEVPGLSKDDLEVTLAGSTLTIKGQKTQDEKSKDGEYLYSERLFGSFNRSIELPTEVKADKVDASFKNGVLEVHLPKSEDSRQKVREISIN